MEVEHRRRRYWFARLCWPVTQHTEVTVSCVLFHSAGLSLRIGLIRFRFVTFERDTSDLILVTSIPRPLSSGVSRGLSRRMDTWRQFLQFRTHFVAVFFLCLSICCSVACPDSMLCSLMFVLIIVETSSLHIVSAFFFPVIAIADMWSAAGDVTSSTFY
jgi:hypothetical protein